MMDPMDNALEILEDTAPEYSGGLINHGPMAADAMIALGRPEAVRPWVEYYRRRLHRPERRDPVTASTWAESLGNRSYAGWHAFFDGVVSEKGWTEALREWLPRLSPGFAAAGAHGAIRTAHAARALTRRMTFHRVRELAAGLAYWASHYQALPGRTEEEPRIGPAVAGHETGQAPSPPAQETVRTDRGQTGAAASLSPFRGVGPSARYLPGPGPRAVRADGNFRPRLPGQCRRHPDDNRFHAHGHRDILGPLAASLSRRGGGEAAAVSRLANGGGDLFGFRVGFGDRPGRRRSFGKYFPAATLRGKNWSKRRSDRGTNTRSNSRRPVFASTP